MEKTGLTAKAQRLFLKSRYSTLNICFFALVLVLLSRLAIYIFFTGYAEATGDARDFFGALNVWDAQWYQGITLEGYTSGTEYNGGLVNWAFFPLFSLIVRGVHMLTGADVNTVGFILNILFQTAALAFLFQYVLETRKKNLAQAVTACFLLSLGCYSLYFASYYTESLYLLLFVAAMYFLYKKQYLWMGVCGFFLTLTRNMGVLILIGLLIQVVIDYRAGSRKKKSVPDFFRVCLKDGALVAGTLLTLLGLVSFMIFLGVRTGDPLAFVHAQAAWDLSGGGNPVAAIISGFASGIKRQVFFAACSVAGLFLCIYLLFQKRYAEAGMAFALLLIPISVRLQSIPRYLLGNAVFMLAFTDLLAACNKKWPMVLAAVSGCLLEFFLLYLWFCGSTFMW